MAPRKLRLRDGLVSSTVSPVLTDGRSRSKMWPCTHTVETSLIWKQTVCPASISMPGEMSFCTITPEMGDRTASVLGFAAAQDTVWKGIFLLAIYSAGLAVPFLLTSLGIERFLKFY